MKLTVAIPIYNAERFLDEAIQSVLAQTYKDFELWLVDDGSTDNSMKIAEKYLKDSRVKVFSDGKNLQLSIRLNKIAQEVQTEYLMRMDSDDMMHPQKIEKQMAVLEAHPEIDVLGTNAFSIDENNNGEIEVAFTPTAGGVVGANTIVFIPTYDGGTPLVGNASESTVPHKALEWSCSAGTLPLRYRPPVCR